MSIELISDYLDTYSGRDKFLKTMSYMAKLATITAMNEETAMKWKVFSSKMSECRIILRLLDDIPMLHYAVTYGWGKQEPDWLIRWANLIQIASDVISNPIEHICWAGDHKLLKINTESWDNVTTWLWISSLHLSLIKSIRKITSGMSSKRNISQIARPLTRELTEETWNEILTSARLIFDLSYAISYLPSGVLWGGRLKTWQVGALGTVSSLIGLYQALSKQSDKKKSS